jgi:hypothetical protein
MIAKTPINIITRTSHYDSLNMSGAGYTVLHLDDREEVLLA